MSQIKAVGTGARVAGSRPFKVSIEGNIGSGKSTCIKFFQKHRNVEAHAEPLDEWRNVGGHNMLGLLYKNVHKWTFPFQHYVHLSRLKIQTSPPSHPAVTVKMFERSVQNSRHCFVENAKKQNYLEEAEYQVLMTWFDYSEKNLDINLDLIVYLRTTPQVVYERMMKRARAEEAEVPLEYLQEVFALAAFLQFLQYLDALNFWTHIEARAARCDDDKQLTGATRLTELKQSVNNNKP